MNNYDEITNIIEEINIKIKEIDKQMMTVEEVKHYFGNMDSFITELEVAYKEFDSSLSNCITRTQALNKMIIEEGMNSYSDIYRELNDRCKDIIDELLSSYNIVGPPIEAIDTTPAMIDNNDVVLKEIDKFTITDEFINEQVNLITPIKIDRIDEEEIPLPTPIQPDIEVLDM